MSSQIVSIVATVVGPDRTGLVELLSKAVSRHGGNWEESRLAHLAGQFAGMLRIELSEAKVPELEADLRALSDEGLKVSVTRGKPDAEADLAVSKTWTLNLVGQDRPGIVAELSRVLAEHGLNVEELSTECESAPMSGEVLFKANARLSGSAALDHVRDALEGIGPDLMVELEEEA